MNNHGKENKPFFFLIDFEMENIVIRTNVHADSDILFDINGHKNFITPETTIFPESLNPIPPDFKSYKKAFEKVISEIEFGNSFLTNLTWKTRLENRLNLKNVFFSSHAKYRLFYNDKFVVSSPESFIKIKNKRISSYPMKGTIDASIIDAEEKILNDPKEKAEHNTIVDLIRNDLSIVSKHVHLEKFRYTDLVKNNNKNLIQVSSKIVGNLEEDYCAKIGSILFSLLPAGSISGAPKKKTVEIIKEAEIEPRGYYSGVSGYFDGQNLDSFILIRFIEKDGNKFYYRSGGGITFMSDLHSEYNELLQKIYVPTN